MIEVEDVFSGPITFPDFLNLHNIQAADVQVLEQNQDEI
jgi:hypothetical protein